MTTQKRRLAVSYSRFSDPKQAGGDSADRQDRLFRDFCQHHNLTPSGEVFADRGVSGYHGTHRRKGRLGDLVRAAQEGRFEAGTVIVIEAWDRLGRLIPNKQVKLIEELVETGVSIGVCRLGDIFTADDFGTHKWTTLAVFVQIAYQESKQKADRVASSWAARRKRAAEEGRSVGCPLPAWVEKAGDGFRLIPDRAEAVRRVFRLAAEGMGHERIVAALTTARVKAFARSGRWTPPYVANILNDRRACGEMTFRKGGKADGKPVTGYYPAAVTEDEYHLARAGQEQRLGTDKKGRALMPRDRKYVNTFRGLLVHARDGRGFELHNAGAPRRLVLMNASADGGVGKFHTYTIPYHYFEECVLGCLKEVDPKSVLPTRDANAPSRADVLRATLGNVQADVAQLKADLKAAYSKAIADVLRDKEAEEERVATALQEEMARTARPAEKAWGDLPTLVDLVRKEGDEARTRLRPVLRSIIESMYVLPVRRGAWRVVAVQAFFREGGNRAWLIAYRPAGNGRQERRPAPRSWSDEELRKAYIPAQFDLRHHGFTCLGVTDEGREVLVAGWEQVEENLTTFSNEAIDLMFAGCERHELP